ncbi:MAG TPA: ScpA family protein [Steroidobacteraceae bacterium]|jgi:segregation and condensation protein A|nr:ScpA family protein [Steroidobacteraceae bacterium]
MAKKAAKPDLRVVVDNSSAESAEAAAEKAPLSPEQVEMPFAIVNGEAITQLPKDLYIPPQALEVFLEAFEGPLDLLLYMIRRQNLDILDIPIADITRQYMDYIGLMQDLQLELAGEYMVMAATLAEIKSRMLLPRATDPNAGEESDPRADLVRRLQEYERFKSAAESIDRIPRMDRDTWVGSAELGERKSSRPLPQIAMQEMLLAFRDVVLRAEMFAHHHVQRERLSVRVRMSDILSTLERSSFVEFVNLFKPEEGRMGVTVTFVAILELVREGLIEIVQTEAYAPIHVRKGEGSRGLRLAVDNDAIEQTEVAELVDGEAANEGTVEPDTDTDIDIETEAHTEDVSPTTDADGETHE